MGWKHQTGPAAGAFGGRGSLYLRPAAGRSAGREPRGCPQGCTGAFGPGIRAGFRPAPGLPAGRRRPLLRRSSGPLPRPHSHLRHAAKLQPDGQAAGTGRCTPRHAGAHGPPEAGRGRLGRRFESPAGKGVYLSLILRPALSAADAQSATISAAVAVARAVKALCGLELGIKWVNDLYYQGRKVCGILTEAGTDMESGQLEWLVVGIGST